MRIEVAWPDASKAAEARTHAIWTGPIRCETPATVDRWGVTMGQCRCGCRRRWIELELELRRPASMTGSGPGCQAGGGAEESMATPATTKH